MASSIQILRSNTAKERPFPGNLLEGQPALNANSEEPGLFFKASDGSIVKFGPAAITSDGNPPNTGGVGQLGNTVGELWLDMSSNEPILKVYDGEQWVGTRGGSVAEVTSVNGQTGSVILDAGDVGTYTSEEIDDLVSNIDFPVTSVNSKAGAVTITASDVNAYTKSQVDALVGGTTEPTYQSLTSVNADRITTKEEAAQFLRSATLGPSIQEVDEALRIGSRGAWLTQQMSSSFNNDSYSEWIIDSDPSSTAVNPPKIYRKPGTGWFGGVAQHLKYPGPLQNPTQPNQIVDERNTGLQLGQRVLFTMFVRNNPSVGGIGSIASPGPGLIGQDNGFGVINTYSEISPVIDSLRPRDRRSPLKSFMCKVAWILGKVFPVGVGGGGFANTRSGWPIVGWHSVLARHAFTTWSELLEEVTYSVSMAVSLTYLQNQKSDGTGRQPDENYAREIMQLFTLGLSKLNIDGSPILDDNDNPIQTYDNEDIRELARVFTGLTRWDLPDNNYYSTSPAVEQKMLEGGTRLTNIQTFSYVNSQVRYGTRKPATTITKNTRYRIRSLGNTNWALFGAESPAFGTTFVAIEDGNQFSGNGVVEEVREDPFGVISRLKHYIPWYDNGKKQLLERDDAPGSYYIDIPAGTDPETAIKKVISGLVNHPTCAPNVAKMLIRFSTTSNPSPEYVARVATVFRDNGQGVVGHMPSIWKAIFTDPEATLNNDSSPRKGRIRDGFENYCNLVRSLNVQNRFRNRTPGPNEAKALYVDGVPNDVFAYGALQYQQNGDPFTRLGTWPGWAPSIFGFYPQEYTLPPVSEWGIIVPELSSLPPNRLHTAMSFFNDLIAFNWNEYILNLTTTIADTPFFIDYTHALPTYSNTLDVSDLIDELNLILCGGALSYEKKAELQEFLEDYTPTVTKAQIADRVSLAVQLITYCNEFWVS